MQTSDVRETAQNAVDQSKTFLGKQVDDKTTQLGQQIGSVAQELRSVGDQLKQSPIGGPVASYVDQGVGYVERLGQYLQDANSDRLVSDLESFARQQPWVTAAGALVLGFAASRFLKTSSTRRYRSTGTSDTGYGSSGYGSSGYGSTTYGTGATSTGSGTTGTTGGYGTSPGLGYGTSGAGAAGTGGVGAAGAYDADIDATGIRSGGERYAT